MSLMNIFAISGSGMSAQSVRLNTTASNLANSDSVSSSYNATYRARMPVFKSQMVNPNNRQVFTDKSDRVGVSVAGVIESKAPALTEYNPNHPLADENGYIYRPNVNVMEEMANMISASRTFQVNVEINETAKQLMLRTINMGQ